MSEANDAAMGIKDAFSRGLPDALDMISYGEEQVRRKMPLGLKVDHTARYVFKEGGDTLVVPPIFAGIFSALVFWPEGAKEIDLRGKFAKTEAFAEYKANKALNDAHALQIAGFRGDDKDLEYVAAMNRLIYFDDALPALTFFYNKVTKKIVKKFEDAVAKLTAKEMEDRDASLLDDKSFYFATKLPVIRTVSMQIHEEITGEVFTGNEEQTEGTQTEGTQTEGTQPPQQKTMEGPVGNTGEDPENDQTGEGLNGPGDEGPAAQGLGDGTD